VRPPVVAEQCTAHDYDDPGEPVIAWDDEAARAVLVDALVGDAHRLLGHLPAAELGTKAVDAVALLALVAGQHVESGDGNNTTKHASSDRVLQGSPSGRGRPGRTWS
jgi:hypothetical protein